MCVCVCVCVCETMTMKLFLFPFQVRGPFVETFCIEKDSYIDAI